MYTVHYEWDERRHAVESGLFIKGSGVVLAIWVFCHYVDCVSSIEIKGTSLKTYSVHCLPTTLHRKVIKRYIRLSTA